MKLTTNFKLICYIFLIAISTIATSHAYSASVRSTTRSKALSKTKMDFSLIKRIFTGIGKAIIGKNEALRNKFFSMLGCLKQTDGEKTPTPTTKVVTKKRKRISGLAYKFFDETVDQIVRALKWLVSIPSTIFGYICKWKKNVVQWIASLFAAKKVRKYRRMVESGQTLSLSNLKRYKSAWSFMGAIKSAGETISKGFKYVGGKLWNFAKKILLPFLKKYWTTIKNAMIAIRDSFFGKNSLIGKMVACSQTLSTKVITAIQAFFEKIKVKYQRYKGIYGLGLPYVALYGGDMLFTALCDANTKTQLKDVATKIQKAEKTKNQRRETIAGGKLFGIIMKFQTTFKSDFSGKIDAAIKADKKAKSA